METFTLILTLDELSRLEDMVSGGLQLYRTHYPKLVAEGEAVFNKIIDLYPKESE